MRKYRTPQGLRSLSPSVTRTPLATEASLYEGRRCEGPEDLGFSNKAAETDAVTITYYQQETDGDYESGDSPHEHGEQNDADVQDALVTPPSPRLAALAIGVGIAGPTPRCVGHHRSARLGVWMG